jgi:SAM-dependent methyltransferase
MTAYDILGRGYAGMRRPDPHIAEAIEAALADAETVVNVGAGTGSYEPAGRIVLAVEPSEVMIRQRSARAAPCVRAAAELLPLRSDAVDAAMAILTVHHWTDPERGLREMRRIARKRVVLLTWVPDGPPFWLTRDYFPEILAEDRRIFPETAELVRLLERLVGTTHIAPMPIPHDCADGFLGAYWQRPEAYLRREVRDAISSFAGFDPAPGLKRLSEDIEGGRWAERNRHLRDQRQIDLGYRLIRCEVDKDRLLA